MESQATTQKDLAGEIQLVSFALGKETFAIEVGCVRQIVKVEEITHVPNMPGFVEGVMNLRGQITTVIDMGKRFGVSDGLGLTAKARIIVAEIGDQQLGMIVDSVEDVIRVPTGDISPPPKTLSSSVDARFLTGICKLPESLIMLLDLSNILTDEETKQVELLSPEEKTKED